MAIPCYLAMTAAEMEKSEVLPKNAGWMACHFSQSSQGLTNLPRSLPPGTLLMLDDAAPVSGHDPALVEEQLREAVDRLSCVGIFLDFQRPQQEETAAMAWELCQRLPGLVTVSASYARGLSCPVCLPPVPCSVLLPEYLTPWKGREIWLEGALTKEVWEITPEGAFCREVFGEAPPAQGFRDEDLHCHYRISEEENCLLFTLWRSREDLESLKAEAESNGVTAMAGLWQDLGSLS